MTDDPDKLMDRTRAAVCIVNANNREDLKMAAFLALFHPEIKSGSLQHIQLRQAAREGDNRR